MVDIKIWELAFQKIVMDKVLVVDGHITEKK